MILRKAEEKIMLCEKEYAIECTDFLDPIQGSFVRQGLHLGKGEPLSVSGRIIGEKYAYRSMTLVFTGGYEDAERQILAVLPEYILPETILDPEEILNNPDLEILKAVRFMHKQNAARGFGGGALGHRDYLGAMMGLGIRREVTGDILIREDGADCIVLPRMAEYVAENLTKAGRAGLTAETIPVVDILPPENQGEEIVCTLASLRLDNALAAAFHISRTEAKKAIGEGLVFVDHREAEKADQEVGEGALLVIRHKGRVRLREISGETRKGRIRCIFVK